MNLLILEETDFIEPGIACITGRRLEHIVSVLKKKPGDSIDAGQLNGKTGKATLLSMDAHSARLTVSLQADPPEAASLSLILALPRPLMFKRILQAITTFGIKEIHIIQTAGVEKSYWQSRDLDKDIIHEQFLLGLEQARDTIMPALTCHHHFDDFVSTELPKITRGKRCLVAHPGEYAACPSQITMPAVLAIGPESGLTEREVAAFVAAGFEPVQLGSRILRVETAVSALLGRLLPLNH